MIRRRRFGLQVVLFALLITSCSEGGGVYFDIVNQTNNTVYVWGFYERCEDSPGLRQDYYQIRFVAPRSSFYYSSGSEGTPHQVACVQVADLYRRLLLSEPYEHGATYVIQEGATPIDPDPVPSIYELREQSWLEGQEEFISEHPYKFALSSAFTGYFVIIIFLGVPYGIYRTRRDSRERSWRVEAENARKNAPPPGEVWR